MAFDDTLWDDDDDLFFDDWSKSVDFGLIQHGGDVYYDPRTNRFIQIRGKKNGYLHCSDFCEYYEDAKTSLLTQTLSSDYLIGLIEVKHIDKFNKAEWDGIGFCAKGAFKDLDNLVKSMTPRRRRRSRN